MGCLVKESGGGGQGSSGTQSKKSLYKSPARDSHGWLRMCGNKPETPPSTVAQDLLQKDILLLTPCTGYPLPTLLCVPQAAPRWPMLGYSAMLSWSCLIHSLPQEMRYLLLRCLQPPLWIKERMEAIFPMWRRAYLL